MDDKLKQLWHLIRQASGDDRYERYLQHQRDTHPGEPVLERKAFFVLDLEGKWSGVNRCC